MGRCSGRIFYYCFRRLRVCFIVGARSCAFFRCRSVDIVDRCRCVDIVSSCLFAVGFDEMQRTCFLASMVLERFVDSICTVHSAWHTKYVIWIWEP